MQFSSLFALETLKRVKVSLNLRLEYCEMRGALRRIRHSPVLGGMVRNKSLALFGRETLRIIEPYRADKVFLEKLGVEYTISVPFERFVLLKERIEKPILWWQVPGSQGSSQYFENRWKPQSWAKKSRFIFIRNSVAVQNKGAIQLDLFEPVQEGHEFKVIVTNKTTGAGKVARFHEGRGYQEKIYGELKNQAQMGYVPARRLVANKVYLLCSLLAHNLSRELKCKSRSQCAERRKSGLSNGSSRDSIRCVAPSLPEPGV